MFGLEDEAQIPPDCLKCDEFTDLLKVLNITTPVDGAAYQLWLEGTRRNIRVMFKDCSLMMDILRDGGTKLIYNPSPFSLFGLPDSCKRPGQTESIARMAKLAYDKILQNAEMTVTDGLGNPCTCSDCA